VEKKWKKELRNKMLKTTYFKALLLALTLSYMVIFFLSISESLVFAKSVMESENFEIQFPNLNSGAGTPTSSNYEVGSTIGQTAAGLFSSNGYRVRSGFQYVHSIIPFSFSVDDIAIDFGTLTANNPVTDTSTLTVKAGGAGGYQVKAEENHPMENAFATEIADTICDNGLCDEADAEVWTLDATTGFGFNMTGDDIPSDFTDSTYFRQFADASSPENPESIMEKSEVTWDYPSNTWPWESEATITYKVNIGSTQAGGNYQNIITFIAIPAF
jgi:hypothetical protein